MINFHLRIGLNDLGVSRKLEQRLPSLPISRGGEAMLIFAPHFRTLMKIFSCILCPFQAFISNICQIFIPTTHLRFLSRCRYVALRYSQLPGPDWYLHMWQPISLQCVVLEEQDSSATVWTQPRIFADHPSSLYYIPDVSPTATANQEPKAIFTLHRDWIGQGAQQIRAASRLHLCVHHLLESLRLINSPSIPSPSMLTGQLSSSTTQPTATLPPRPVWSMKSRQ